MRTVVAVQISRIQVIVLLLAASHAGRGAVLAGRVLDGQGSAVPGATVTAASSGVRRASAWSGATGLYRITGLPPGDYRLTVEAAGFTTVSVTAVLGDHDLTRDITLASIAPAHLSIVITDRAIEPEVEHRNGEVFDRTLFSRDDQLL